MSKTTYYIYDIGSGRVREVLNHAASEHGKPVTDHPQMKCIRANNQVELLDLYEVTEEIKDRMIQQSDRDGLAFIVFAQAPGKDEPRELSFHSGKITRFPTGKPVRAAARRASRPVTRTSRRAASAA